MSNPVTLVVLIIVVALVFDFINGFHDAANAIATVVSTRVLSPTVAVFWAAFFNFIAAFVFSTGVAKTIGKGLVDPSVVDPNLILAALLGGIAWNLITWWLGLPSSSSHALMGGLGGAGAIFLATSLGIPMSTTHTITGAIVGVGAANRMSAVRWGVAGRIVWAWIITIPMAATIAALSYIALR